MQIKAVIIDDEQHSLETTDILVRKYCPGVLVMGLADSPEKGIALIDALKPELVFLDIAMPTDERFRNVAVCAVQRIRHYFHNCF